MIDIKGIKKILSTAVTDLLNGGSNVFRIGSNGCKRALKAKSGYKNPYIFKYGPFVLIVLIAGITIFALYNTPKPKPQTLSILKHNPETKPQDFYLPISEIKGAHIAKNVTVKEKGIEETEYLPYFVSEDNKNVYAITRSKNGLQKLVISKADLTAEVWESEKLKPKVRDWEKKAASTPLYQYLEKETWQNYSLQKAKGVSIERFEDYALITQDFVLSGGITGQNTLKVGFDGKNYLAKWTYTLNNNENTNRLVWETVVSVKTAHKASHKSPTRVEIDNINIDWGDFKGKTKTETTENTYNVYFYEDGIKGALEVDPTVALSTGASTIQIDVANRYRAIMNTGDTTDYILIYDRAQDDSSPDNVFEIAGPHIYDNAHFYLRDDPTRKTTILESSSTRVRVRVKGRFNDESGSTFLDDDGNDDDIEVTEDYTFTTEGMYISQSWDFKDGHTMGANDHLFTIRFRSDVTSAAHSDTIYYGDGITETSTSTDTSTQPGTNIYRVIQANSTYQDAFIGIANNGWFDADGGTDQWYLDTNISGGDSVDVHYAGKANVNSTLYSKHYSKWFFLMLPQNELGTEAGREAYINDYRNPDVLSFTTGSEWQDTGAAQRRSFAATPSLNFESGSSEYIYATDSSSLSITGDVTVEAWIKPESTTASTLFDIAGKWDGSNESYLLAQYGDEIRFYVDSSSDYETTDSANLDTNTWYHVTAVYNDSAATVTLYINGTSEPSTTTGTIPGSIGDDGGRFHIGAEDSSTSAANFYDGKIDEIRVWAEPRTEANIQQNMYTQVDAGSTNLNAYFRLNENTGTTTYDETSNNNDGTLVNTPTWATGFVADHYNEAEGAYTMDASGNQISFDIDGGSKASTQTDGTAPAGGNTITVDSTSDFDSSGTAYIEGDRFTYTGTSPTTFTGVATSGEDAVYGHADNSIVSQMTRHKTMAKIRNFRSATEPTVMTKEGETLIDGTDYNLDYVPISDAYFADALTWSSTLEDGTAASTSLDVGSTGSITNLAANEFVAAKYGNGAEIDENNEYISIPMAGNVSTGPGTIEFWYKETEASDGYERFFGSEEGSDDNQFTLHRHNDDTIIRFRHGGGYAEWTDLTINAFDGAWHHIRLTYDFDNNSQYLYLDGINQGQKTAAMSNPDGSSTLRFGNSGHYGTAECNGILDEIRIYDTVLGPENVADGGDTGDSDEYLASSSQNYTLDFDLIDSDSRGEYLFIGADHMFSGINVDLSTLGVEAPGGAPDLAWEYWNGNEWASLESISGFTDGTTGFTDNGSVYWDTNPTNWRKYSVNGSVDLYYIRASLSSGGYSTSPIENFIRTDTLIFQDLGNIGTTNITLTANIPVPDILAHWHMDEAQGTSVGDTSGEGETLTFGSGNSAPAWLTTPSKSARDISLSFDGTDDYLYKSSDTSFDFGTESFAISGWFRHTSAISGTDTLVAKTNNAGYKVYMNSSGYVCFGIDDDATFGPEDEVCTTSSYADSKWHQFVAVKNSTSNITLYLDGGAATASDASLTADGSISPGSATFYIGIDSDGSSNPWDGFIDEVIIYDTALTAAQAKREFTAAQSSVLAGQHSKDPLTDGLVGYWKLDEESLGTAPVTRIDTSGNGNDLTDGSGSAPSGAGVFGRGTDFEYNNSDYLSITDGSQTGLEPTSAITIATWVYRQSSGVQVVSKAGAVSDYQYYLKVRDNTNRYFRFGLSSDGTSYTTVDSATLLSNSTWYHVVAVWDGTNMRVYLNGEDDTDGTQTFSGPINGGAGPFEIGAIAGDYEIWNGLMDEVRVYNRALSPKEIRDLYNYAPGPVLEWKFDEGTGASSVTDTSKNANTGTMNGSMTENDWVPGKFGYALNFDGSNDAVAMEKADSDIDFNGSEAFSASAWVKINTMPGSGEQDAIITKWDTTNTQRGYRLIVENDDGDSTGNFQIDITDESVDQIIRATGTADSVAEDTWYHVGFTFNGGTSGTAEDLLLYVNGIYIDGNDANGSFAGLEDVTAEFVVGEYDPDNTSALETAFAGIIDHVQVYNYELTAKQMVEHMNAGHPAPGSPVGSPVAYWKFDEGDGSTAYDSSNQSNNGTLGSGTTAPSWTLSGKYDKALDFDGNDYVTVGDATSLDITNTLTISAWVKKEATGAFHPTVAKWDANGDNYRSYWFGFNADDEVQFYVSSDGGSTNRAYRQSNSTITDSNWHHIVAVFEPSTKQDIYIDGVLNNGTLTGTIQSSIYNGSTDLHIGRLDSVTNYFFDGKIDEVKIFNSALTEDQIKVEYNQGSAIVLGTNQTSGTDPVGWWKLDEGTGTSVADMSGNGNTGTAGSGGSAPTWAVGKIGQALEFDGSDDYVSITHSSSLDLGDTSDSYTVEAWIYPHTAGATGDIVSKGQHGWGSGDMPFEIETGGGGNGNFRFGISDGSSSYTGTGDTETEVTANQWYHVVGVRDVSTDTLRIYINGILADEDSDGTTSSCQRSEPLHFSRNIAGNAGFDGILDEVKIYNYARTPAQIAKDYSDGSPIGWWKFDECTGTTLNDASLNAQGETEGKTGTITIGESGPNTTAGTCDSDVSTEAWSNGDTGKFSHSLDFDGVDDYATISNTSRIDLNEGLQDSFTIAAWIYPNSDGENDVGEIFDKGSDTFMRVDSESGNNLDLQASLDLTTAPATLNISSALTKNTWHHIAMTWTDDGDDEITLWIDGINKGSSTDGSGVPDTDANDLLIGGSSAANFDGQVDDFRIYQYELTASEIKNVYNEGSAVRFD